MISTGLMKVNNLDKFLFLSSFIKYIIIIFTLVMTYLLVSIPRQKSTALNQEKMIHFHPMFVSMLSFGYDRLLSSFYWIIAMIQSDIDRSQKEGERSWMYYRFLQIAHLDPFFYENYSHGGLYLSIVKDDVVGAKLLFEKGLKIYKEDFHLNYYGAFNDFFELNDKKSALEKYRTLLKHPESKKRPYLYTLIARIQSGQLGPQEAEKTLKTILQSVQDKAVREKIQSALYAIKAQRDIACLNSSGKQSCSLQDYNNNPYLKDKKGTYKAKESWESFEIKGKR